jgi:drug/metabolite transporter (DMT)-like permease
MVNDKYRNALPLIVIIGMLAVSTASIFIRFAQQEAPSFVIAALRMIIATILISPIALRNNTREIFSISKKDLLLIVLSGFFLSLHFATWVTSLAYTSIASSVVLVSTGPLWVALLSVFLLHEKLNNFAFLGIFIALIGVILISLSDSCITNNLFACSLSFTNSDPSSILGDILALAGAVSVAGYFLIGRILRPRISLISYIFLVYGSASIFLIILLIISRESIMGYSNISYIWIFLTALIPQIIGHTIYNWTLKHISATLVSMFTLGEPIGTTILALFIFKEYPGLIKIIAIIFILSGIYYVSKINNNKEIS